MSPRIEKTIDSSGPEGITENVTFFGVLGQRSSVTSKLHVASTAAVADDASQAIETRGVGQQTGDLSEVGTKPWELSATRRRLRRNLFFLLSSRQKAMYLEAAEARVRALHRSTGEGQASYRFWGLN